MKRKLIKRNKAKFSSIFALGDFYLRVIYRQRKDFELQKNSSKYKDVLDHKNTTIILDRMFSVPVVLTAKNKRSRIKNTVSSYRIFTSLDNLNEECGTNYTLRDIKPEL